MYSSIQICRAVAAILVMLYHLGLMSASEKYFGARIFDVPFSFGDTGVDFFFVLSGFIITFVHFRDIGRPSGLSDYLRKRAIRIYPVYWIVFLTVYFTALIIPSLRATVPHELPMVAYALALLPLYKSGVWGSAPVLTVAWTLQYEMLFYALFGLLILRPSLGAIAACAFLANYVSCQLGACSFPRNFFASNLVWLFFLGAAVAWLCRSKIKLDRPLWIAGIGAIAFLLTGALEAAIGRGIHPFDRDLVYGFYSATVIFGLVRAEDTRRLMVKSRWAVLSGDASYSLYLTHWPIIGLLCKAAVFVGLTGVVGAAICYPVIVSACAMTAVAFHLSVERPVLRYLRNAMQRWPAARPSRSPEPRVDSPLPTNNSRFRRS